jgi:hypothetical protein
MTLMSNAESTQTQLRPVVERSKTLDILLKIQNSPSRVNIVIHIFHTL